MTPLACADYDDVFWIDYDRLAECYLDDEGRVLPIERYRLPEAG